MKIYLFSYGTLQKGKVQWELFGRALKGSKDVLEGYILSAIEITDETFLANGEDKFQQTLTATNEPADKIEGMVFEITEEELLVADQYEPVNYKRTKLTLRSRKEAWAYSANE